MEDESKSRYEPKTSKAVVWFITIIWLGVGLAYLSYNLGAFKELPPNGWGDTLAGFFAPLAFLWLVAGYIQQGHELKQNTEELKRAVEQQTIMAQTTEKQTLLFTEEYHFQRHKEKLAAQPLFRISVRRSHISNGKTMMLLEVQNNGKTIQSVSFSVDGAELTSQKDFLVMRTGSSETLSLSVDRDATCFGITVCFLDGLQNAGALSYRLNADDYGYWDILLDSKSTPS